MTTLIFKFKKAIPFPRFSMAKGEEWTMRGGTKPERIFNLKPDERFEFAGGQCLRSDIEIISYTSI